MIALHRVDPHQNAHVAHLWNLLEERPPSANISHHRMPTREQHAEFVRNDPYQAWYIIEADGKMVGSCYITRRNEIGVAILKAHQRCNYARRALQFLLQTHEPAPMVNALTPARFVANINPANAASIALFTGLGAVHIQSTFAL